MNRAEIVLTKLTVSGTGGDGTVTPRWVALTRRYPKIGRGLHEFFVDQDGNGFKWNDNAKAVTRGWVPTSNEFAKLLLLAAFPTIP